MRMVGTVSIAGAGRVGRALARRLRELGWTVGAVVTRSASTARAAVRAIGGGVPRAGLTRQLLAADVVLVTTPDDSLRSVASLLARMGGREWRGKVALHTSGALDRSVLAPLARLGAATGSLHPMQTFSGRGVPQLEGIVFGIEGDLRARKMARAIVRTLGGVPVVIEGRGKPAYHAAGALVAGLGLAVMEAATRILMEFGFTRRSAARALLPLVREMLENFESIGPRASWTGPLSRGDFATVAMHRKALRFYPREFGQAYAALTRLAGRVLAAEPRSTLRRLDRVLGKN
ncbi:MAG TPA: DUF2520 domain-containing protein [Candidatus Acidoferrales bacterium]|jgi:predicted short-subunit dehydrogenase-like oxidoreductase (DUF2520 family)|nr:DUF2520 domain-containing protein [Candidatus Acidoferrales bacterium]